MKRYKPLEIGLLHHPVMIVGEAVGKQTRGRASPYMWQGNKTADFMMTILDYRQNIVLTNALDRYNRSSTRISKKELHDNASRLCVEIMRYMPSKVLILGNTARHCVNYLPMILEIPIRHFPHPSYIMRFNLNREIYAAEIRQFIDEVKI